MSNKKLYKDTFDKVHMSEEVFGKVRNMSINERQTKRKFKFKYAMTFAALAIVFVLSNVITYASSGTTLVEKVAVYIDGKKHDISEMEKSIDKDGNVCYEYTLKDGEKKVEVNADEKVLQENNLSLDTEYNSDASEAKVTIIGGELKEKNGKIYLIIGDNLKKIDITEDLEDRKANGEFELEGKSYQYTVEGSVQENNITIHQK